MEASVGKQYQDNRESSRNPGQRSDAVADFDVACAPSDGDVRRWEPRHLEEARRVRYHLRDPALPLRSDLSLVSGPNLTDLG